MIIETKYNRGDYVFMIYRDEIIKIPIRHILITNSKIRYEFVYRSGTSLDKEITIVKDEVEVFDSLQSLIDYWSEKHKIIK